MQAEVSQASCCELAGVMLCTMCSCVLVALSTHTLTCAMTSGVLQDTTFSNPPQALQTVEDSHGGVFSISTLPYAERSLATEALFLLVASNPAARAKPQDAGAVLAVVAQADAAMASPAATSTSLSHTLHPVLYALTAFAMIMNPPWSHEGGQRGPEQAAFTALTQSKELAAAVGGLRDNDSGVASITRFVYGVAGSAMHERLDSFEGSKASSGLVAAAIACGALASLVRSLPH
jgi:hypothetical protein